MNKTKGLPGLLMALILTACIGDPAPMIEAPTLSGLQKEYTTIVGQELTLTPTITSTEKTTVEWQDATGKVLSTDNVFIYKATAIGTYKIILRAKNAGGSSSLETIIKVNAPDNIEVNAGALLSFDLDPSISATSAQLVTEVKPSDDARFGVAIMPDNKLGFTALTPGKYTIALKVDNTLQNTFNITVTPKDDINYQLTQVFEYRPAPGQFVNSLPTYEEGDSHETMCQKVLASIGAKLMMDRSLITLGGWGGYVVFGFDHMIPNVEGLMDFKIEGNAFEGYGNNRPDAPFGGSCEPGIIYVAYDANNNGQPDDPWYEIKGSGNFSAANEPWFKFIHPDGTGDTVRDYEMTYHRPTREEANAEDGRPDDPMHYISIKNYIMWENNKGQSGYKYKNIYHNQSYYPMWIKEDKMTFNGIRLANNSINEGQFNPDINEGSVLYILYAYRWGYADNYPNREKEASTDIGWAIDPKTGQAVQLPGIHFIKVVSGVDQESGWLGECSTEINFSYDLHSRGETIQTLDLTKYQ